MNEAVQFLIHHGYTLLLVWVLVEQMGLPIPAVPLLLAAGGLAGSGRMDLALAMGVAIAQFWQLTCFGITLVATAAAEC